MELALASVIYNVACLLVFITVTWRSSHVFRSINKVTLHWARLVLQWVTACGQVNHIGT